MKPEYLQILVQNNLSSIFLDQSGCIEAMDICYIKGKKDGAEDVLNWLSKMDYLSDNIDYIIEEYKNQTD